MFSSTFGVVFQCSFSVGIWYSIGPRYSCSAKKTTSGNTNEVENIIGDHLSGKTFKEVETLYVYNEKTLQKIPAGFANFLPQLIALEWFSGSLTSLSAEDLEPFTNLVALSFAYNKLVSLESNLFKPTPNLQIISFYGNQIESVGSDLLTALVFLKDVRFQANRCIDIDAFNEQEIEKLKLELKMKCVLQAETTEKTLDRPRNGTLVIKSGSCLQYRKVQSEDEDRFDFAC